MWDVWSIVLYVGLVIHTHQPGLPSSPALPGFVAHTTVGSKTIAMFGSFGVVAM
jgi:hypothetical protein